MGHPVGSVLPPFDPFSHVAKAVGTPQISASHWWERGGGMVRPGTAQICGFEAR